MQGYVLFDLYSFNVIFNVDYVRYVYYPIIKNYFCINKLYSFIYLIYSFFVFVYYNNEKFIRK